MAKKSKGDKTPRNLWVINQHENTLLIPYTDRSGNSVAVAIPQTYIPINLTLNGSRRDIINAPNYKRAIMLKLIREVSEEEVEKIFKNKDAQVEQDRIYKLAENISLNGDETIDVRIENMVDRNDDSSVLAHTVTSIESHDAQNNKFRSLVNSGKMNVQAAKLIKREIKKEEDKKKRNRTLFVMARDFIEENE